MNLEDYRGWLLKQGFAEQTIRNTLIQAKRVEAARKAKDPASSLSELPHIKTHLVRIRAAAAEGALPKALGAYAEEALAVAAKPKGVRGGRKGPKRKLAVRSVDDASWAKLLEVLSKDTSGPGRVLYVEACTGLRIGDLLRIPRKALLASRRTGRIELVTKGERERQIHTSGAQEAWTGLVDHVAAAKGENVAEAISVSSDSSSSGAAYQACRRHLKAIAEKLGLDRVPTHRLRRTIAVQALRVTEDTQAVAELLGHAPGSRATLSYVDEARSEDVAKLSSKIRKTFGGAS